MKKQILYAGALAACLGLASAELAAAQAVTKDPAAVKSGTYKVEDHHTQVGFSLSHLGITDYAGFFHNATGSATIDAANPAASKLNVTVPIASVMTTVPSLGEQLKTKNWFDAETYPTATFVSTKITLTGKGTAVVDGDLTLHGVTRPVSLNAHLVGSGVNVLNKVYSIGFSATTTIKRSDFGIKTAVPMVGDDVTLNISLALEAQS